MREIFTLNFGSGGNFSSAYFWQIQDMYDGGFEFHEPFFLQNRQGYFPRMIGVDLKESMTLPSLQGPETQILWSGKIQRVDQAQSNIEKWTDLLLGMASLRNLVPVYRDESPKEEVEEKVRWFAEQSDRLQAIHTITEGFYDYVIEGLEVIYDFYPKIPNVMVSMGFGYKVEEELFLHKLADYSNLLLVPCTEATDKQGYAEIGVALDVLSYFYRERGDISRVLKGFFELPRGNTAGLMLNNKLLSDGGVSLFERTFVRGEAGVQPVRVPEGLPTSISTASGTAAVKIALSTGIVKFYQRFASPATFRIDSSELNEAKNYISSLIETFSNLDLYDDEL